MKNSLCRAWALGVVLMLAGCGVKGPLYMPAPEKPAPTAPQAAPAAETAPAA